MTDKELKKMNRRELLELLIEQTAENEALHAEQESLKQKLSDRSIAIEQAGSLAEASLSLNDVFSAAQAAADQYLENVQKTEEICVRLRQEADSYCEKRTAECNEACRKKEEETREKTEKMIRDAEARRDEILTDAENKAIMLETGAKKKAHTYWAVVSKKLDAFYREHKGLQELLKVSENMKQDE